MNLISNNILPRIFLLGLILLCSANAADTLRLKHDETYLLLSGKFGRNAMAFKKESVISGNVFALDPNILVFPSLKCPFESGKNYIVLTIVKRDDRGRRNDAAMRKIVCEDILPDTPANRQKLIKKYNNTTVVYEPVPAMMRDSIQDYITYDHSDYVLVRIRNKEKVLDLKRDSVYIDSVIIGDVNKEIKRTIYNYANLEVFRLGPYCENSLPKRDYLLLASVNNANDPRLYVDECPVPYSETELARLKELWKIRSDYLKVLKTKPRRAPKTYVK